jgi:hypothetical protein
MEFWDSQGEGEERPSVWILWLQSKEAKDEHEETVLVQIIKGQWYSTCLKFVTRYEIYALLKFKFFIFEDSICFETMVIRPVGMIWNYAKIIEINPQYLSKLTC